MAIYDLIRSVTATGSQTTVTFSSIPATYTDLYIVGDFRNGSGNMKLTMNGDTGANYDGTYSYANGSIWNSFLADAATGINTYIWTGYGGSESAQITHILNYANTNFYKNIITQNIILTSGNECSMTSGIWKSNAAITSVTYTQNASFSSGCKISLYGI